MTWGRLQFLVKGLLSGDYDLPEDEEVKTALLQMAMEEVCNISSPLSLYIKEDNTQVLNNREIIRQFRLEVGRDEDTGLPKTINGFIIRPLLPSTVDDIIDMDEGLIYAVARLMASYIANIENKIYHKKEAYSIMDLYKVNVVSLYDKWNQDNANS